MCCPRVVPVCLCSAGYFWGDRVSDWYPIPGSGIKLFTRFRMCIRGIVNNDTERRYLYNFCIILVAGPREVCVVVNVLYRAICYLTLFIWFNVFIHYVFIVILFSNMFSCNVWCFCALVHLSSWNVCRFYVYFSSDAEWIFYSNKPRVNYVGSEWCGITRIISLNEIWGWQLSIGATIWFTYITCTYLYLIYR